MEKKLCVLDMASRQECQMHLTCYCCKSNLAFSMLTDHNKMLCVLNRYMLLDKDLFDYAKYTYHVIFWDVETNITCKNMLSTFDRFMHIF